VTRQSLNLNRPQEGCFHFNYEIAAPLTGLAMTIIGLDELDLLDWEEKTG